MRLKNTIIFLIIVMIIGAVAYMGAVGPVIGDFKVASFNDNIKKGLDLKGGVSVLEEIQEKNLAASAMDRTIELLTMRINPTGVSEIVVTKEGNNRIRIDIPGQYDTKAVIDNIAKSGKLEFRDPDGNVILSGSDVKKASVSIGGSTNTPMVNLEMNTSGTKKFADATTKFLGKNIGIYMDETQISNPTVNTAIIDGSAQIEGGNMTMAEATKLSNMINSGALPVTLKNVSANVVGPTLGKNALPESLKAGMVAIIVIFAFMLLYYRIPGLIANVALAFFILLVLIALSVIHATLTLSGIAGLILTIGMAVDANVLIFERIKEELKSGKSPKSAIEAGFHRALSSILDSNITTILSGVVLYMLGSGTVKGFALTLIIGVALSMISAITFTRFMMKLAANAGWFDNKWAIGTFGVHDIRRGLK
ncbi:MAG TPA: protein translocase subunit SecD [Clostridiaceae bacterium]